MRKIIVTEFMTLDGVIEAPGGNETAHPHGGWQAKFNSAETGNYKVDELASVDSLLLGKNTYELFAGYWLLQKGPEFADPINTMPKYVVSTSLDHAQWNNSHLLRNIEELAKVKETEGGNILVYGSGILVKSLLHHDLVDELRMMIFPVSIGGGLRLFDDNLELKKFELKYSKVTELGIVILEYKPIF